VVLLAERGVNGGAISSGRSCRRNWRRSQPEMGDSQRERRKRSGNTALTARSAGKRRPPDGAPKKKQEYRYIGGHKKGGSDTMLNILYIERKNKREKRESGSVNTQWTTLYCVVIDIDMSTITSLYRRESGALTPNLTNVGQAPHIH
jgi:hypothetical protein